MPWSSQWSGGGEAVASGLFIVDANGNVVASIDSSGNVVGNNFYVQNKLYYDGEELSAIINELADGRQTSAFLSGSLHGPFSTTGAETMLVQTQFTYNSSRSIWVYLRNLEWSFSGNTVPAAVAVRVRAKLASNGNVGTSDPGVVLYEIQNNISGFAPTGGAFRECNFAGPPWNFANGSILNVAVSMQGYNSSGANGPASTSDDIYLVIVDMGTQTNPGNQVNLYTGTPPPAPVFKDFDSAATDSQSFQQSGAASNGSGSVPQDFMYFGEDPGYAPNGNWRSYCWFTGAGTGGGNGSLADIVGVSSANVQYLDVLVYTDWWYDVSGGTLSIGMTGAGIDHVSEPGGATYNIVQETFYGRYTEQWVSVLGTPIETAVLNGSFTGIVLGPGPTNSYAYYGYADGTNRANPVRIRGGYYK